MTTNFSPRPIDGYFALDGYPPRSSMDKMADRACVKDFGAKGDGLNDDTSAIQSAVNSAKSIYFPGGTYVLTSAVSVPTGVRLSGVRANVSGSGTWLKQTASDYHLSVVGTSGSYNQYNEIEGITFTGANGLGIRTAYTESMSVHDCLFSGTVYGLYMSTNANEQDVKAHIYRNVFGTVSNTGIWTGDTRTADCWFTDNTFIDNASYAIRIGYMDGGYIVNNAVFSSLSSATENNGILVNKPVWSHILDNQLFQVNGYALEVSTPSWTHIERNVAVLTGQTNRKSAFYLPQYSTLATTSAWICGNIARQTYGSGFEINLGAGAGSTDVIVCDNSVNEAGYTAVSHVYDGFLISNVTRLKLRGNTVDGNSQTRYWLNIQNVAGMIERSNTFQNCINTDAFVNTGCSGLDYDSNNVGSVSATGSLSTSNDTVLASAAGGAITLTLPSTGVIAAGKVVVVIKTDATANAVTIAGNGLQTINGAASTALAAQYNKVQLVSDGSNWFIR